MKLLDGDLLDVGTAPTQLYGQLDCTHRHDEHDRPDCETYDVLVSPGQEARGDHNARGPADPSVLPYAHLDAPTLELVV